MAGGRLSRLFACSLVGLLGVFLRHDAEASEEVRHKMVGETAEFSLNIKMDDIVTADWKFEDYYVTTSDRFKGRVEINPLNFSLTVRGLTLEDSGTYHCLPETNKRQIDTVTIKLKVHAPITSNPLVTVVNSTWNASAQSCAFFLECSVTTPGDVSFTWTGAGPGPSRSGAALRHVLPEEGDVEFNCTASNPVSRRSTILSVSCRNETGIPPKSFEPIIVPAAAAGAALLVAVIVGTLAAVCCCRRKCAGSEPDDSTLYAFISEFTTSDGPAVYKNTDSLNHFGSVDLEKPQPSTVYDEIQLRRMRKESVSPYQEIN